MTPWHWWFFVIWPNEHSYKCLRISGGYQKSAILLHHFPVNLIMIRPKFLTRALHYLVGSVAARHHTRYSRTWSVALPCPTHALCEPGCKDTHMKELQIISQCLWHQSHHECDSCALSGDFVGVQIFYRVPSILLVGEHHYDEKLVLIVNIGML